MATEVLDREKVEKALNFLETQKTLLTNCTEQWRKLSSHFSSLEKSLLQKSKSLDTKLETLESETKQTLESLQQEEDSIPDREAAAIARVDEQKQAGLAEFEKSTDATVELSQKMKSLCRKMDSAGLSKLMTAKRKDAVTLRGQIVLAIAEAVDKHRLVLDAVKDFVEKKTGSGGSDRRWACGTLISALFPAEEKAAMVAGSIAESAATVAESWKVKIESEEGSSAIGQVETAMFLQFVVGFGVSMKFEHEFLKKLLMENTSRRDMPKIALALGFGEKIGDLIDELVKSGKEIDAVYFACECGLTERFPPIDMIQNYYKKSKTEATTIAKSNRDNADNVELNSFKAIIKCVEDHKLESKFSLQNIKKRVSQLEKNRAEKRKSTFSGNKRERGGGGGRGSSSFRPSKFGRGSDSYSYSNRNAGLTHAYQGSYNYPRHGGYKGPSPASYTSQYGAHSRSPAALAQYNPLPTENIGAVGAQATGSYGSQTNYSAYDYRAVAPSSYQPPYAQ